MEPQPSSATTARGALAQPDQLARIHVAVTIGAIAASLLSIAASQILLGASLGIFLWRLIELLRKGQVRQLPWTAWQMGPIGAFFLCTLLSAAASQRPGAATPQLRKFFVYVILLTVPVALASARPLLRKQRLALVGLLLGAGALSAGWSYWQYFRKWNLARTTGQDFTASYIADRTTGFMSHWMTFGGEMLVMVVLALAFLLFAASSPRDRWRLGGLTGLFAVALLLNWTRGIWIGAGAAVVYLVWQWRRPFVLALPLLAGGVFLVGPESMRERALSIVRPRGNMDSNAHRQAMFRTGVAMVRANPVLGIGPEMVKHRFAEFAPADIPRPFPKEWWYDHLHSIYFQFAAERGVPALLAILSFAGLTLWRANRRARALLATTGQGGEGARLEAAFLHAVAAMWVGILVTGCFEYNLGDSEVLLLVLGISAVSALPGAGSSEFEGSGFEDSGAQAGRA